MVYHRSFAGISLLSGREKAVLGAGGMNSQIIQIYMDYSSLPSIREITLDEIRFYYEPLIEGLCELQKMKKGK